MALYFDTTQYHIFISHSDNFDLSSHCNFPRAIETSVQNIHKNKNYTSCFLTLKTCGLDVDPKGQSLDVIHECHHI